MNFFAFSSILTIVIPLILSFIIIIYGRTKLHRIWVFCNIATSVWGAGSYLVARSNSADAALMGWRIAFSGALYISVFFYHFVCLLGHLERKKVLLFVYIQAIFFHILSISTQKIFTNWQLVFGSLYYNKATLLYCLTAAGWFFVVCLGHYELINIYKRSTGFQRTQAVYLIVGFFTGFLGGFLTLLPAFSIYLYPVTNLGPALYAVIVTYAIFKCRLLDIRVAITRTTLFIIVYTLVLGFPFIVALYFRSWLIENLGGNWWMMPLGLMGMLATVGPFIYIFLERKAEAQLLKEQRRYQQTLKQASIGMVRIRNLQKLLELMTHIITKTVRISHAAVYLYDQQNNEYKLQVSRDKRHSFIPLLAGTDPLIAWLLGKHDPIIYEEIKRRSEENDDLNYKNVAESMQRLSASVIIPSFLEYRLTGFIVLGDKLSGQVYTPDDLNVFQVLATQAALAIENAQFYEEAKTMQEQIAQAEKMATVGTMADGLSHQINNRFYALSLIASDTIDTIRMTDTSQCTPEVQTMITEINKALERIQSNVMQGGEVVKGILKYTRKGEEGFEPLSLDQILDGTLAMIQYKIRLSEIDIVREYPQGAAQIHGNLVQMQEVFFNFIDNAYDSIMERRSILKEEGYRGRITITLKAVKDSMAVIHIADNGMGVKESNARKLFTPFFTTKTSSRKGTGLGLYVIRRIITEMHNGRIHFESEYQRGTRFIIELPVTNHTPVANHSVV